MNRRKFLKGVSALLATPLFVNAEDMSKLTVRDYPIQLSDEAIAELQRYHPSTDMRAEIAAVVEAEQKWSAAQCQT